MEDLAGMQEEINEKLQHGFDTRHIYEMFSSFVTTIKDQSGQIREMREQVDKSDAIIETLSATIRTMELNIQGFHSFPSIEDDAQTLKANITSRRASLRPSRRTSSDNFHHQAPPDLDLIKNAVQSIPNTVSSSTSPRDKPQEVILVGGEEEKGKASPSTKTSKNKKNAHPSRGSQDAAWRYKKRRVMRQMSNKILEENNSALNLLAAEEEKEKAAKDREKNAASTGTSTGTGTDIEDVTKGNEKEAVSNGSAEKRRGSVGKEENLSRTAGKEEKVAEGRRRPSERTVPPVDESGRILLCNSQSPIATYRSGADEVVVDQKQTMNYRIGALEASIKLMVNLVESQRAALMSVPGVNAVVLSDMTDSIVASRSMSVSATPNGAQKLDACMQTDVATDLELESEEQSNFSFFDHESFTEDVTSRTVPQKDVEEEDKDNDIGVRDEEEIHTEQDDVASLVRVKETTPAVEVTNNVPYDDSHSVKFNEDNELPAKSVSVISRQVCGSENMKKVLEKVFKGTEKMLEQGLRRLPKPPPQVTANDMLTDSIVATLAQSMLKRGLLDDLRHIKSENSSPRVENSHAPAHQVIQIQRPTPTEHHSPPPSHSSSLTPAEEAQLKQLAQSAVSRKEVLEMIKLHTPDPSALPSFTRQGQSHLDAKPKESFIEVRARKNSEMNDDISLVSKTSPLESPRLEEVMLPIREATMGERARTVLEQHVDVIEHEKASMSQLEELSRNLTTHVAVEVQKIATHYESLFDQFSSGLQVRQEGNEKNIVDVRRSLQDLEQHVNIQIQQSQHRPKKKEEDWKSDLQKVSQSIHKAREDQRTVAKMLVEELENLQKEMKNRVDERRLEQLAATIEEKVTKEMGQSVSGINLSMAKIINAVRTKADRSETEAMIQNQLQEAEESLRTLQEDDPAGAFKCISCGTAGKKMTPNASLDTLSFASAVMSQSAEVRRNRGGDLDQTTAVLNRQAGLRPVSRQQKAMTPKTYTPTSAPSKEIALEPLYRRAKHANQAREIPKIPNITFGAGNSNQYKLDHVSMNNSRSNQQLPNIGTQSAPSNTASFSGTL